jgi:DNA-binding MarR family transcriptional regulator
VISESLPEVTRMLGGEPPLSGGDWEMTIAHVRVLRTVPDRGSCSMEALSHRLGVGRAALAGLVDDLVRRGLLERSLSLSDNRTVYLRLAGPGREARDDFRQARRLRTELALQSLPDEQLLQVAEGVALLRYALLEAELPV